MDTTAGRPRQRSTTGVFYQTISKSPARGRGDRPELVELLAPRSVADIGCGTGAWLAAFKNMTCKNIWLDGPWWTLTISTFSRVLPKDRSIATVRLRHAGSICHEPGSG